MGPYSRSVAPYARQPVRLLIAGDFVTLQKRPVLSAFEHARNAPVWSRVRGNCYPSSQLLVPSTPASLLVQSIWDRWSAGQYPGRLVPSAGLSLTLSVAPAGRWPSDVPVLGGGEGTRTLEPLDCQSSALPTELRPRGPDTLPAPPGRTERPRDPSRRSVRRRGACSSPGSSQVMGIARSELRQVVQGPGPGSLESGNGAPLRRARSRAQVAGALG